jgi:hypothetical protein
MAVQGLERQDLFVVLLLTHPAVAFAQAKPE